jgi:hypothetical protein
MSHEEHDVPVRFYYFILHCQEQSVPCCMKPAIAMVHCISCNCCQQLFVSSFILWEYSAGYLFLRVTADISHVMIGNGVGCATSFICLIHISMEANWAEVG